MERTFENDRLLSYKEEKITIIPSKHKRVKRKTNELPSHLHPDFPDVLCFMEDHLNQSKLK
jgi:hypothetical protein